MVSLGKPVMTLATNRKQREENAKSLAGGKGNREAFYVQ
jgi:hypothetical protein